MQALTNSQPVGGKGFRSTKFNHKAVSTKVFQPNFARKWALNVGGMDSKGFRAIVLSRYTKS
jgi:hypothetical protein